MRSKSLALFIFCMTVTAAHAEITATQTVEKEVISVDSRGVEHLARVKAETVAPGEEVIYTLRFINNGAENAETVVLVMPVPEEVSYVEGSVFGEKANVTFSADGGQTYVARGRLTVTEGGAERPAKSDEITHIKWAISETLPAKAEGSVSYRAILK